jgi:hypothetical protein
MKYFSTHLELYQIFNKIIELLKYALFSLHQYFNDDESAWKKCILKL